MLVCVVCRLRGWFGGCGTLALMWCCCYCDSTSSPLPILYSTLLMPSASSTSMQPIPPRSHDEYMYILHIYFSIRGYIFWPTTHVYTNSNTHQELPNTRTTHNIYKMYRQSCVQRWLVKIQNTLQVIWKGNEICMIWLNSGCVQQQDVSASVQCGFTGPHVSVCVCASWWWWCLVSWWSYQEFAFRSDGFQAIDNVVRVCLMISEIWTGGARA